MDVSFGAFFVFLMRWKNGVIFDKMMIKRNFSFIGFVAIALCMTAQTLKTDDGIMHWEADFNTGLNSDGYQFDFGIAYFPIQFFGIKTQIGAAGEIEEIGDWGKDEFETGHSYTTRFKFTPSLVLRSPRVVNWRNQDVGFYLFAESGVILSPGASGSSHAKWANWNFRAGINLQTNRFIAYIGYGITDFTLYSGYASNHWGSPDSDKYLTHSGFIGGAYKF